MMAVQEKICFTAESQENPATARRFHFLNGRRLKSRGLQTIA